MESDKDWFELYLDKYPDLPSVVLIRSMEVKHFPREFLQAPVLDICCGDGFFIKCLGIEDACGCDIDEKAVEATRREKIYRTVAKCDARDLGLFPDAAFSTIISNCGLEHVDGIEKALASIARVLRKGGRLIMSVPDENLNAWFYPRVLCEKMGMAGYGRRLCDEYNGKQQHLNIHSSDVWRKKLEQSGLEVEKSFSLFNEKEYKLITFFESFVLDSFPGNRFRSLYGFFRKACPEQRRKRVWRKLLKPIYLKSSLPDSGGELFIVARKW